MTAQRLAGILVAGLFFLHGGSAFAQSCPPTNFTGTITVGDGSEPDEYFYLGAGHCCGWWTQTTGPGPEYSLYIWQAEGWDIRAWGSSYFSELHPASVTRVNDPVTSCSVCTPAQTSFQMYAQHGSFDGTAISLPSGVCIGLVYGGPFAIPIRESDCTYDFSRGYPPPWEPNHWAFYVYRAEGATGPGYGTYTLTYGGTSQVATTWSSHNTTVNFCNVDPGTEMFDVRGDPTQASSTTGISPAGEQQSCSTPSSCGKPVRVVSGNMYLDQTDASMPGLGGLEFIRSYNSVNRGDGLYGMFGRGWFSTYERRIEILSATLLKLRQASGVVAYFADPDGDLRFDASFPRSSASWIVKQPDGSYIRSFRAGGNELYDAAGRLTSFSDPSGNVTSLTYVGSELRTITSPGGRSFTVAYTGGRPSTLSGPAGLIATYTYDASNRLETVTYADAASSGYVFTYDAATGAIATVADLSGRFIEKHAYDGAGRAYTSEIADGQEKYTFTYGTNQTTVTDALNNVTTYDYVSIGGGRRVTRVVGPCEGCGGAGETHEWSYQEWATTATDPDGKVTTYNFEPGTGDRLSVVETSGTLTRTTTYTYDSAGHVTSVSAPDQGQVVYTPGPSGPTAIQDAINRITNVTYTARGQLETVQNPRLKTTRLAYNATTGDLTSITDPLLNATTFGYDATGRRNRVTTPVPFSNATNYTYDVRGQLTRVDFPDTGFVSYTYDRGGRRATMSEKVTSQLTRVTTYAYDNYGRLHTVTDGNTPAGVTTYDYDVMSRLTTITDARGEPTVFHYDAFGRMDRVTYPGTPPPVETFTYYPSGRLRTRTDRKGLITTHTYDDLGRLAQKSYSDGSPAATFSYDLADRLTSASNADDTLNWVYDLAGQLQSEESTANASLVEYPLYDGSGNRMTLKLNGTVVLGYTYDDDDRIRTITRGSSTFTFAHDEVSRRKTLDFPNSGRATYGYDTKSRLTGVTTTGLDSHGHPVTLTSSTYTYDFADDRLTKGGDFAETYTYDTLSRLTQVNRGNQVREAYSYDKVGNRLSALNSSPWAYDDRNELLSYPSATFQYDLNGNMISKIDSTGSWTYDWNIENQLTRVLKNGAEVTRYAYDPLGRRVEKVAGGVTTTSLYGGEDILRQTVGTNVTTYIHGPGIDEPLASENAAGVRTYIHPDGLGSIVKTSNSSGAAVSTLKYNAFGLLESGTPSSYAFTGREWEPESGLYYYRARYYDPKTGRLLNEDPTRFWGGINFYSYVFNNPVSLTDPLGLQAVKSSIPVKQNRFPFDYCSVSTTVLGPISAQATIITAPGPNQRQTLISGTAGLGPPGCTMTCSVINGTRQNSTGTLNFLQGTSTSYQPLVFAVGGGVTLSNTGQTSSDFSVGLAAGVSASVTSCVSCKSEEQKKHEAGARVLGRLIFGPYE